jgi:hypothetical protein
MHRRRIALFVGLVAPLASAAGCSLINAYDAVQEAPGNDVGDDGPGNDATSVPDGTTPSESGSSGGGGDASSDATPSDGAAEATTTNGPEAAVDAGLPAGAIVIGGHTVNPTTGATTYVLAVLDPATGELKNQTTMAVGGVAYDPAFDVWYIFDNGSENSVFATPGLPITLHVRHLDTRPAGTWAWTELATLSVPPIFLGQEISVLVDRLAYVSAAPADSGVLTQLTVIDTTNFGTSTPDAAAMPMASTLLGGFPSGPVGITGAPPTGGAGGLLALLQNTATGVAPGSFQLVTVVVNGGGTTIGGNFPLGSAPNLQVSAGCGTSTLGSLDEQGFMIAVPVFGVDGGITSGELTNLTIGSGGTLSTGPNSSVPFQGNGTRLNPIAFATCSQFAIVSEGLVPASDTNYLFVLPLGAAAPDGGFPGFPVQQVTSVSSSAFEPFTNTVVVTGASSQANFILGLQLNTSPSSPPTLSNRAGTSWTPPTDLVASWIAVRQPASFPCP